MSNGSQVKISLSMHIGGVEGVGSGGRVATIVTHVFLYLLQSALTHCLARAIKESHRACGTKWKMGSGKKGGSEIWVEAAAATALIVHTFIWYT